MVTSLAAVDKNAPRRSARDQRLARDLLGAAATVGAVGAGAALAEAVVVPALLVGAVVLAPRYFPGLFGRRRNAPLPAPRRVPPAPAKDAAGGLKIGQALAKTVTYRVAVTGLDFSWNYMILGDVAVSAGLSAATLVLAPVFYFLHETLWNTQRFDELVPVAARNAPMASVAPRGRFTIDRALAKTITFRAFSSTAELTTNYVVVRDFPTAVALSAFGLVFGPFLYYGHEKLWERFGPRLAPQGTPAASPAPAAT
jgi:uncharacterized membrane protein